MTKKTHNRVIKFGLDLNRQIERAAADSDTDVTKWVRAACREKLARDEVTRKQIAAQKEKRE